MTVQTLVGSASHEGFRFNGPEAFRRGGLVGLPKSTRKAAREWIASQQPGEN